MVASAKPTLRFDGRVAIVTGAGRGLGRAHALALAARGAHVVVNDIGSDVAGVGRDRGPAADVADEIVAAGGSAVPNFDTVTSEPGAKSIVATAVNAWGRVDIIVNNAGILAPGASLEVTADDVRRHFEVHVMGTFNVTRAAWPLLVKQRYGRVIVTTSVALYGGADLVAYSTAKGGVLSLGRSLALAGHPYGVRVNLLAPAAETRMVADPDFRSRANLPRLDGAALRAGHAPERVSSMVLAVAHESCPCSGEVLIAGGGRYARLFLAETHGSLIADATPEAIASSWQEIVAVDRYELPRSGAEAIALRERLTAREEHR